MQMIQKISHPVYDIVPRLILILILVSFFTILLHALGVSLFVVLIVAGIIGYRVGTYQ